MTTKSKKIKINIMGKQYKVEKPINDTLKAMSDALHAHEVALLTWVHKDYQGRLSTAEKELFRKSLLDYCMQIPEAQNILVRMTELDIQAENSEKEKKEETEKTEEKQNKEEKVTKKQNKKEKDTGAKE